MASASLAHDLMSHSRSSWSASRFLGLMFTVAKGLESEDTRKRHVRFQADLQFH